MDAAGLLVGALTAAEEEEEEGEEEEEIVRSGRSVHYTITENKPQMSKISIRRYSEECAEGCAVSMATNGAAP